MLAEASLLVALTVQHGSGAEACLGAPRLERSVERRLKRRVFVEAAKADLRFVVSFEKRGEEIEARIEVSSIDGTPRGSRSLVTASHCSALDDSLALSVALLVDQPPDPEPPTPMETPPNGAATTGTPAPAAAANLPVPKRPATPITVPDDVVAPREPLHVRLGAAAVALWGVLPAIRAGLALNLTLLPRQWFPVTLQGEGFWPAEAERDRASGVRLRLIRAGLSLCPALWQGRESSLSLCFGQKLGFMRVDGFGFDHDRSERRLTFALTVGGEARVRLFSPVSLRAHLGGEVPVVRDRFASGGRNPTQIFEASPVAAAAEIGLEASLR